jgi:putative pre-16S rRNA nuclease
LGWDPSPRKWRGFFFFGEMATGLWPAKPGLAPYLCPMGRILALDYGLRRTGIAVTDPEKIIVQGLDTRETGELMTFLKDYIAREKVELLVIGYPFTEGNWGDPKFRKALDAFIELARKTFDLIPVVLHDERYTSIHARDIMSRGGLKKKDRENKALLDRTSAILILQEYLGHI